MKKALFLDRDGVINVDHGYVCRPEDFEFTEGILEWIRAMQERGWLPIVVTNQSGIGRGYYSEEEFEELSGWMLERMRGAGIGIDRSQLFFCPHAPEEGCACRKPAPGMFLAARDRFGLDMNASLMVGDKASDIEAAKAAGVGRAIRVEKDRPLASEALQKLIGKG
ncbi:D-glycero-beta-D-manno-heptose 1,7-bisphosphate 7-phosphatase [Nitratifractor sp.]